MAFLSISVDLAESTRIKQQMTVVAGEDRAHLETLYERFANVLYQLERDFYEALNDSLIARLDGLYLVKSVGDEYWYVYDLPEDRGMASVLAVEMLGVLMRLSAAERFLSLAPPGKGASVGDDPEDIVVFDIPVKIFVDVIDGALEVNSARYEHLKDILLAASGKAGDPTYAVDGGFVEVCRQLNMGAPGMAGTQGAPVAVRADFIGLEVDRFFRLAKCCHSGLVGVGENLMRLIPHATSSVSRDLDHLPVRAFEARTGEGLTGLVLSEAIGESRMKGVVGAYTIHHLFSGATLGEAIYASPQYIESLMAPTQGFLAENGFYAIERDIVMASGDLPS